MAHGDHTLKEVPWTVTISIYIIYVSWFAFGHIRDFFRRLSTRISRADAKMTIAPLRKDWEDFFTRRLYYRVRDSWERPILSNPGAYIDVVERVSFDSRISYEYSGKTKRCLNLGSYNYLGFSEPGKTPCNVQTIDALRKYGSSPGSTRAECGTTEEHLALEEFVAKFLKKEACVVHGMGFGTNLVTIPCLVRKGDLILSDSLNHASIVTGARSTGAVVAPFIHNDPADLERLIRKSIVDGQPRTHQPWKRILIIVEGIYSMEGEICRLPEIVALKKKYKCYVYLDEAHSIGALGKTGRGCCEHTGVPTSDIDIMMGTFTKSFGSVGGYIAGSKDLIDYIRYHSAAFSHEPSMSSPCVRMALAAFRVVAGEDGTNVGATKLKQLASNSLYLRENLRAHGFLTLGEGVSPVIPVMVMRPTSLCYLSRALLQRGFAVVVVGYPATSLTESRVRFCVSSSHTKQDLDNLLEAISKVGEQCGLKFVAPTIKAQ
jgi:serine palmitoyltransferase